MPPNPHPSAFKLAWSRLRQRQGPARRKRLRDATRACAEASSRLKSFGSVTDLEFASIANSVSALLARIGELQSRNAATLQLLTRQTDDNAFDQAFAIGKRSVELVHSCLGVDFILAAQFESLDRLVENCQQIKSEFDKNRVKFRCLSVGFAIEAARCVTGHQAVFKTVAADFHRIDSSMESTIEKGFEELMSILAQMRQCRDLWSQNAKQGNDSIASRLDSIRSTIFRIETDLVPCVDSCSEIQELAQNLSSSFVPVLMHLQSQDMTRQKLEHIATALDDIASAPPSALHTQARLLASLLADARSLFDDSAQAVVNGVANALEQSDLLELQLSKLQNTLLEHFGRGQLAQSFGNEIKELAALTDASAAVHLKIADLDERIANIVHLFTTDIANRQQDIRLIALNAQVAASRLLSGGALEKLAQETSLVSDENETTSQLLSATLQNALAEIRDSRVASTLQLDALNAERAIIAQRTENIDTALSEFIQTAIDSSQSAAERSSETISCIRNLTTSYTFPQRIAETFDPAAAALASLADATRSVSAEPLSRESVQRLQAQRLSYTMETERALHDRACAPATHQTGTLELF